MKIGTRGSALALAQAGGVAERLGDDAELVTITTSGDRGSEQGDKSRWVSALERALLERTIDIAVHSAKDVPAQIAGGLELVAFPAREDPADVICGAASLAVLPAGARIGTSSLRRSAQIRAIRPDLAIVALRGNVDTRLRKLAAGEVEALVLAAAGLRRLGRAQDAGGVLGELVPAAGQGALALQARTGDEPVLARARALSDVPTEMCVAAERALTRALGASCDSAVGAHATAAGASEAPMRLGHVTLSAWVGRPDGSEWIADRVVGRPHEAGERLAERLLAAGAAELLAAEAPAR
jgi:hydroxymethylbilane synthase